MALEQANYVKNHPCPVLMEEISESASLLQAVNIMVSAIKMDSLT